MAIGSGNYTKAEVYLNSLKLSQMSNVQVQRNTNNQKVYTHDLGAAGVTVGAAETNITVTNMVPSEDFEADPEAFGMLRGKRVTLTIVAAGRSGTCEGWFENDTFDSAVNANASHSFTFWGGKLLWD
jgi:hypothetical protein